LRWLLGGLALVASLAIALLVARKTETPAPAPARVAAPVETSQPLPPPAAPAASLPPVASADPEAERRAEIRARLEASIAEHLPDLKLSSDELDAAADALVRLRAARRELAALPRTPENAARLRELTAAIGAAYADFEYVVELDPAEFTERVEEDE
jgi:hypothetical protein